MIVGVLGCMAQKDQHEILRRAPHVDLVVGPGRLGQLPALLEQIAADGRPCVEVSLDRAAADRESVQRSFAEFAPRRLAGVARPAPIRPWCKSCWAATGSARIASSLGCAGPEQSRPAVEIIDEVRRLADDGCLDVTLLGQTVNSYRDTTGPSTIALADLLCRLNEIEGIRRLKFVTNHPRHMTDALLQAVRDLPKVSPYFHVPAQSGSNEVLRRMNRGYTAESYREVLARIRQTVPEAAITSDFIVGFCGETEEEFQQTAALVRDARFKNSFIFSTAAGRARKPPSFTTTTCRRRSSGGGTTTCWRFRTPFVWKTISRFWAARSRFWWKARARRRKNAGPTRRRPTIPISQRARGKCLSPLSLWERGRG